jgi:ferredoxin-thioredoxin reductase catalytic subunit/rubredoxin
MTPGKMPSDAEITALHERLGREAEEGGYHLNPDRAFTRDLVRGLLVNTARYGYASCPCRLASRNRSKDLDIICPCDYRDPDLTEHDACYCALYVSGPILAGKRQLKLVPERRPSPDQRQAVVHEVRTTTIGGLAFPVWRCRVCGYLCARKEPPEVCPVCKAAKERFERFI